MVSISDTMHCMRNSKKKREEKTLLKEQTEILRWYDAKGKISSMGKLFCSQKHFADGKQSFVRFTDATVK